MKITVSSWGGIKVELLWSMLFWMPTYMMSLLSILYKEIGESQESLLLARKKGKKSFRFSQMEVEVKVKVVLASEL